MGTWQVTNRLTDVVVDAYGADTPDHADVYPFDTYNHNRVVEVVSPPARRVTKLEFVARIGEAVYIAILGLAAESTDMAAWVKLLDWATPEPDGTSVDLDDPRTIAGLQALEPTLIALGKVTEGWAAGVVA